VAWGAGVASLALGACAFPGPTNPGATSTPTTAYVSDVAADEVLRVDLVTGEVEQLFDGDDLPVEAGAYGVSPAGLAWWGQELVVTNFRTGEVLAVDPTHGDLREVVYARSRPGPRLEEPVAAAWIGPELAVLGNDTRNVVVVEPGHHDTAVGWPSPVERGHDLLAVDDQLWVATSPLVAGEELVRRFDLATGEPAGAFAPHGELQSATGLTIGPDELLYVVDGPGGRVVRYDLDGTYVDTWLAGLDQPVALRFVGERHAVLLLEESLVEIRPEGLEAIVGGLRLGRALVVGP